MTEADRCAECGFAWTITPEDAVSLVVGSPERMAALIKNADRATRRPAPGVWSPNGYLWHLIDVLRIGAERLLTTSIDPDAGIVGWDENALAEVRQYESLSPRVGLVAYEAAAEEWVAAASGVAVDAPVEHVEYGTLTAGDIIRRNAHEVQHHEQDIHRGLSAVHR